jgi:hypothetical protein
MTSTIESQIVGRTDSGNGRALSTAVPTTQTTARRHANPPRGADLVPSSVLVAGRFGRMFRNLPVHEHRPSTLGLLALTMIAPPDLNAQGKPFDKELGVVDEDENTVIPAGYTYFGQFVDHDISFDPASSLQRQNDPNALEDFRTPRFDLDSMYGRGPADQPYLYDADGLRLLLGKPVDDQPDSPVAGPDLQRNMSGRALLGDPRNEENLIISQLHRTFLQFHNRVIDTWVPTQPALRGLDDDDRFKEAQRVVRWHYQWVVVHDFLARVCGQAVVDDVLGIGAGDGAQDGSAGRFVVGAEVTADPEGDGEARVSDAQIAQLAEGLTVRIPRPRLLFFHWQDQPFMPVEFSAAAYRFGHSMVRPSYFFNDVVSRALRQANKADPINNRLRTPIFGADTDGALSNLNGFRPLPKKWGFEWKFFLPGLGNTTDLDGNELPLPQPSYKIDTSLVDPLGRLPRSVVHSIEQPHSLAERNLLRGRSLGLPSGQAVARAMGLEPMSDEQLGITEAGLHARLTDLGLTREKLQQRLEAGGLPDVDAAVKQAAADLAGNAPLWYYVLKEAQEKAAAHRLGPVGGRIVAEVIVGLLWGDPLSFLRVQPNWRPELPAATPGNFTLTDLVRFATGGAPA